MATRPAEMTAAIAAAFALACAPSADAPSAWTSRDSAGIHVLSGPPPTTHWQIDTIARTRLGTLEGDSSQIFVDVVHAASRDDGRIVLFDGGTCQILVHGPDGGRLAARGGCGGGPGEFGTIGSGHVIGGDTVLVYDRNNRRLTWLSLSDGGVHDRVLPDLAGEVRILGRVPDGRVLLEAMEPGPDLTAAGHSATRDTLAIVAVPTAGVADTLLRVAGSQALYWLAGSGSYVVTMEFPFGARVAAAFADSGIVVADGVSRRLERYDRAGALRAVSRVVPDPVRPVAAADRDRFVELEVERATATGWTDPLTRRENARLEVDMLAPDHPFPPFDRILSDGPNVWVRDYVVTWAAGAPRTWTVFDAGGRGVARVTTPAGVTITHIGADRVTGVARGEFDEQYVVVYDLMRQKFFR